MKKNLKISSKTMIPLLIMLVSMAVRAFYVSYISIYQNQHDGGIPYSVGGHVGYITWFLTEGKLPDFDVRTADQFWHPPLNYALGALLLKVVWSIFPSTNGNIEIAQLMPYLYVTVTIFLIWRLLCFFIKDDMVVNLTLAFVAFQPGLIIRSAMLNNDALVLMFSVLALGLALQWYCDGRWWQMIGTALAFGLGLMSKKSGAIVALPITILFCGRFFQTLNGKTNWKDDSGKNKIARIFAQFAVFLAIAAPIGLWWYVRNYVRFGVPFDFFWTIKNGMDYEEYLGNMSVLERITDFDLRHFIYPHTYVQYQTYTFQETNPLIALWKSAAFEVWTWTYGDSIIKILSYFLLISRTLLVLLGALCIPAYILKGAQQGKNSDLESTKNDTLLFRVAVVSLFFALLISYYSFCFEYPYVWTMDYRYIETIILCDALFLSTLLSGIREKKFLFYPVAMLIAGFCAASVVFFGIAKMLF